jgi:hypothetical protein
MMTQLRHIWTHDAAIRALHPLALPYVRMRASDMVVQVDAACEFCAAPVATRHGVICGPLAVCDLSGVSRAEVVCCFGTRRSCGVVGFLSFLR